MLRFLLAALHVVGGIAPASRRASWNAQWRADLWHYHDWLMRFSGMPAHKQVVVLAVRAAGSVPHALTLRIDEWSLVMLTHDLKFAWRMLVRRPAFTLVAILVLGLGIGANATIFSWVESVLLQPLPGVDVSQLVALHGKTSSRDDLSFSYPNFTDVRAAKAEGLEDIVAFRGVAMNLKGKAEPRRVWGQLVSGNFFDVVRVRPHLGRVLMESDAKAPGGEQVAVLAYHAWQTLFSGDPSIVGRSITLNARPFTVVGVSAPEFRGTMSALSLDIFVPITMQRAFMSGDRLPERGNSFLQVLGRLAPGASINRAQASLDVIGARLAKDHHENSGRGIVAVPLWRDGAAGLLLPVMATLMAVVGIVLLIACANLAGLLLARAAGRQREVAVRLAVGASRGRLVRQMLLESLLLAVGGGAAGVVLAIWTSGSLMALMPPTPFPVALHANVSPTVLTFAAVLTILTSVAFGLLPAIRASRPDLAFALKDAGGTLAGGARRGRIRSALVVVQVALSVVLLVSAALFLRGLTHARSIDPGFDLRSGVIAAIDLLPNGYDAARGSALHTSLLSRVGSLPGVESATIASAMPLDISGGSNMSVVIDGYQPAAGEEVDVYYNRVAARYFETMGIPILAGRPIDAHDVEGGQLAVVINEAMARRYWPAGSAIGKTLRFGSGPATVVGVAQDGKYGKLNETARNYMYLPLPQYFRHDGLLIVRTSREDLSLVPALNAEVSKLDPNLPLFDVRTVGEHMKLSVFIPRIASTLLGLFGFLALILAVVGLYSVVAFGVAQRTREIGLRMALGATRQQVLSLVLRQGLVLTAIGLLVGGALAAVAAQVLKPQLMGLGPNDVVSFVGTSAILLAVALAACFIPARRATRLDPVRALRLE